MPERIALFGGTFNPIHFGHLITARAAAEQLGMSRVILLPSATPPHKAEHELLAAEHRAAMVRLAILGEPLFEVSDFDLTRPGPSYTVDTVTHFRALCAPGVELFWMIGADSLAELTTWRQLPDLVDKCRIVTLSRTGAKPVDWLQFSAQLTEEQISRLRE